MPHLVVLPFDTKKLKSLPQDRYNPYAKSAKRELVGINKTDTDSFFLEIYKRDESSWIVRADKVTRPSDSYIIKESIFEFARLLELDVIHSNIDDVNQKHKIANEFELKIEEFEDFRTDYKEIAIEVGFGSGRHLLYQAKKHPQRLHIGIEIHTPSIRQILRQIELQRLKNIRVLNYDARLLLEMLPSNMCEVIFVHFPVPWDKKPHRRVISRQFLNESCRVLKKGGYLELRTDSINYYRYSLEVFSEPKEISFQVNKNHSLEVVSKYEARWRREGKDIYTVTVYSLLSSKQKQIEGSFDFDKKADLNRLKNMPRESFKFDDYFVRFASSYECEDGGMVVEVSFGSFDRPEHKYIYIKPTGDIEYYATKPVKTPVNLKAHKTIGEWLYV